MCLPHDLNETRPVLPYRRISLAPRHVVVSASLGTRFS
ncbi:hypothetical protein DAQ1742_04167 [Dickeya aquatica]|uniref:Uncharacterized protein n=1 Tax=Dickeya aquatica TaxID=1401087 RepID=A0A375AFQ4_9GAMM|nr:hypothetical protein DAQ1742_04167 [Dickeya aquatica]